MIGQHPRPEDTRRMKSHEGVLGPVRSDGKEGGEELFWSELVMER